MTAPYKAKWQTHLQRQSQCSRPDLGQSEAQSETGLQRECNAIFQAVASNQVTVPSC